MKHKDTCKEHQHKKRTTRYGIVTVSDTRTLETDDAGLLMQQMIEEEGHVAEYRTIVKDDKGQIRAAVAELIGREDIDAVITTGGTGLGKRDITIEAVQGLFEKELPSFNALFTVLSHAEIGSTALMSRATAGVTNEKAIFCIPGSPKACRLAMEQLILKETNHILNHIRGDA